MRQTIVDNIALAVALLSIIGAAYYLGYYFGTLETLHTIEVIITPPTV